MDHWTNQIRNGNQRFPKPINLPVTLDTKISDKRVVEYNTRHWLEKRKIFTPRKGSTKDKKTNIQSICYQLKAHGLAHDSEHAKSLAQDINESDMEDFSRFLHTVQTGQELMNTSSDSNAHKRENNHLNLAMLNINRKIMSKLLLSENKVDRQNGSRFMSRFNRIYKHSSPVKEKKDFRFIEFKDRMRLLKSRENSYLTKNFMKTSFLLADKKVKHQKRASLGVGLPKNRRCWFLSKI